MNTASARFAASLTQSAPAHVPAPKVRASIRRRLGAWFDRHARDLPWRRTRDPYAIWVSEVMLQQTQVATVIPYYQRFLTAFPNVAALAAADEQAVLRLWEGLGYYRRARDLHRTARLIAVEKDARFPTDPEVLRAFPGLGRYTVNAVLSQAHGARLPILEANSERVLCRLLGVRDDPKAGPTRRLLWEAAEALLPLKRVGRFNQALMELGALVCSPIAPRCERCPLAGHCAARRANLQAEIPPRGAKPAATEVRELALVVRRGRQVLVARRPPTGRWANLWEFPRVELLPGEVHTGAAQRLLRTLGIEATPGRLLGTIKHTVMRFRITLICHEACHQRGRPRSQDHAETRWLTAEEIASLPVASPQRRLAALVH